MGTYETAVEPQTEAADAPLADAPKPADVGSMARRARQRGTHADEYHRGHPAAVAEFNGLTNGECQGGPGGVQWAAVRAWQQRHWQVNGLVADGLVGPETLEAARIIASGDKKSAAHPIGAELRHSAGVGGSGAPAPALAAGKDLQAFHNLLKQIDGLLAGFPEPQNGGKGPGEKPKEAGGAADPMLSDKTLQAFTVAAHRVAEGWSHLTPKQRGDALLAAANEALAADEVPAIDRWEPIKSTGSAGKFHAVEWIIFINQALLSESDLPDQGLAVALDMFHEARHAEQRFKMARRMAGQGQSVATIQATLNIQPHIAKMAAKLPLVEGAPQSGQAERLLDDVVTNREAHNAAEGLAPKVVALGNHAQDLFDALSPSDKEAEQARWKACREQMYRVIKAYRGLESEVDAKQAEKALEGQWRRQ